MSNEYYDHTVYPAPGASGSSANARSELTRIEQGFDKLPQLTGRGGRFILVDAGGTRLDSTDVVAVASGSLVLGGGVFSGAGWEASLASPAAIGGSAPNSGVFTSLRATAAIPAGDATDRVATTAFVASVALSTSLPGQTGNEGKVVGTDGSNASWVQGSQMAMLALINQGIV